MRPATALNDKVFDFNALLHPGTTFEHPRDVVSHPNLSLAEKRVILASWASDASCRGFTATALSGSTEVSNSPRAR